MPTIRWDSRLASVAGKQADKIEKAFGYSTVGDLLRHYPRRYVPKGSLSDLGTLVVDEHVTVIAQVLRVDQRTYNDRRTGRPAFRLEVAVATGDHELRLTFFDKKKHLADWRARTIREGSSALFSGKVGRFRDEWQLTNPQTTLLGSEDEAEDAIAEFAAQPDLTAIYPATATLQSWQLQETVLLALRMLEEVPEPLPEEVRRSRGLVDARQALEWIHRPDSWAEQRAAEGDPATLLHRIDLAKLLARRERTDEARRLLTDVVETEPRHALPSQRIETAALSAASSTLSVNSSSTSPLVSRLTSSASWVEIAVAAPPCDTVKRRAPS